MQNAKDIAPRAYLDHAVAWHKRKADENPKRHCAECGKRLKKGKYRRKMLATRIGGYRRRHPGG